jgi:hypothetical protein
MTVAAERDIDVTDELDQCSPLKVRTLRAISYGDSQANIEAARLSREDHRQSDFGLEYVIRSP